MRMFWGTGEASRSSNIQFGWIQSCQGRSRTTNDVLPTGIKFDGGCRTADISEYDEWTYAIVPVRNLSSSCFMNSAQSS